MSLSHLQVAFEQFHAENPHVYELFTRFSFEAIDRGRTRYSARMVWSRMRWHVDFETTEESYKLNDHHTPYYARLFMADYPEHSEFFETRRVVA